MSKITVTTIAGQTSGSDANLVKIESGDTLQALSNATVGGTLGVTGATTITGDLTVGGTDLLVENSTQNVGMGTTSPSTPIQKFGGSAKGLAVKAGQPTVAVEASANSQYVGYLGQAGTNTYIGGVGGGSLIFQTGTSGSTTMSIDANGRVTKPLQPSFKAVGTNAAYITTTPVQFPNTSLSGGHNVGGHYNTSTHKFTAPVAGRYLFHLHMGIIRITANGGNGYPYIRVNNAALQYSYVQVPTGTAYGTAHVTQILQLNANDYVNVTFTGTNAQYYGDHTELSFGGYLLG